MERTVAEQLGYLSVSDAFAVLRAGVPIYIASAPEASGVLPLRGAWKDKDGDLHFDLACVYLSKDTALQVARAFNQKCIFAATPNPEARGRVYLLQDTVRNRVLSLRYAGLYVADGTHLLTAVADGELSFEPVGEAHSLPANTTLPYTHTRIRLRACAYAPALRACTTRLRGRRGGRTPTGVGG